MSQYLPNSDFKDDEEPLSSLDALFSVHVPWYRRLWRRFFPVAPVPLGPVSTPPGPFDERLAVANCIEASIASCVWIHRDHGAEIPCYIHGVGVRDMGPGSFWLYVKVFAEDQGPPVYMPLHEFLEEFQPLRDLTFTDLHS